MIQATLSLPPEQPGSPAPDELALTRAQIAAAIAAGMWRTDPPPVQATIGGVRVLRFEPSGASAGVMLHFHGGAYRLGAPEVVAPYAAAIARDAGVTVVCPAYRLAPEHPFPAAILDGLAVLRAIRQADPGPLLLSGDSAGGGLAAGLAALAAAEKLALDGLVLLSPWLDLTVTSDSFERNAATDPLFSRAAASTAAGYYLGQVPADHPVASPRLGAVAGFPPTLLSVGEGEVLADDATGLHRMLQAAGVVTSLSMIDGMEHVAVTRGLSLPGSAETFEAVIGFIAEVLARRHPASA